MNVNKTRERVMEFRLKRTSLSWDKVLKEEYKYLGIHTDNRLNWRTKAEAVHKKRMSRFPEETPKSESVSKTLCCEIAYDNI